MLRNLVVKLSLGDTRYFIETEPGFGYLVIPATQNKPPSLHEGGGRVKFHDSWEHFELPQNLATPARKLVLKRIQDIKEKRVATKNAEVESNLEGQMHSFAAEAACETYPYVISPGRYGIVRVYRVETASKGKRRFRIYDRKNDKWGKTLRPQPTPIVGTLTQAGFEEFREGARLEDVGSGLAV